MDLKSKLLKEGDVIYFLEDGTVSRGKVLSIYHGMNASTYEYEKLLEGNVKISNTILYSILTDNNKICSRYSEEASDNIKDLIEKLTKNADSNI